jgi:hypothetical protein
MQKNRPGFDGRSNYGQVTIYDATPLPEKP